MKRRVLEGLKYAAGIITFAALTGGPLLVALYLH